jgi:hypothetical protein
MTKEERIAEKNRHRNRRENFTTEEIEKERERCREQMLKLKLEVLNHYSNGTMHCVNPDCEVPGGAKNLDSLCIDHVNGGGKKHTEQLRKEGVAYYRWLKNNNFPSGFQVLCLNCNNRKKKENKEDYRAIGPFRRSYRHKAKSEVTKD